MSDTLKSEARKAIIYCRVSSKQQRTEGSGLDSQEHRCREYAEQHGLEVEAVFPDDVSGGGDFLKRPGMVALLAYLSAQTEKQYVVIFDDLKRFARDTEFHIKLRRELTLRNAKVECLNFKFEDTPEGKFIETVFAAHGELEREQNGRQVVQKMKARVEQGFHVVHAPFGFKYEKSKRGGKILVRDEPVASVVQEALEGYACGRFQSQVEVQRFLESRPEFPKDFKDGTIRAYKVTRLLTRVAYGGYVQAPHWGVSVREGQHDGLVSYETFDRIQTRLKEGARAPARKDVREDFPLRGFVECSDCGRPLTSCFSKSATGVQHPYYRCYHRPCDNYGKSIRRDHLEGEFETLLKSMQPSTQMFEVAKAMFKDAWTQRSEKSKSLVVGIKQQISEFEKQINQLVERIVDTDNDTIIGAYERKITELEKNKRLAGQQLQNQGKPKHTFDEMFELSMRFLSSPWKLWVKGDLTLKKMVLRLAFSERISYDRKTGSLNSIKSIPFKVLEGNHMSEKLMVRSERFELPTPRFVV